MALAAQRTFQDACNKLEGLPPTDLTTDVQAWENWASTIPRQSQPTHLTHLDYNPPQTQYAGTKERYTDDRSWVDWSKRNPDWEASSEADTPDKPSLRKMVSLPPTK
jgi:hypothetical protein